MDELVNKKGVGVVFSDLEATLIGGGHMWSWEEYTEECEKASDFINLILSKNNYFVIVSSCYHDTEDRVAQKFNIIYNFLLEENKDKIMFFISNTGKNCVEKKENINVHLIEEKQECINIVLNKLKNDGIEVSNIIGIGDDEKDLDMLFRIQELGGTVGVVADSCMGFSSLIRYLDFDKSTIDEIINTIIESEFNIETNRLISKKLEEAKQQSIHGLKHLYGSYEYKILIEGKSARNQELKEKYLNGVIDNDALQKCYVTSQLANRYYSRYVQRKELNGEIIDENLQQKIYLVTQNMAKQAISSSTNLLTGDIVKKMFKG